MKYKVNFYAPGHIEKRLFDNGVQIIPEAASLIIYDPDGNAVLEEDADITESGTAYVSLTPDDVEDWEVGLNYRAEWTLTIDSGERIVNDLFDLVYITFDESEFSAEDLLRFSPWVSDLERSVEGVVGTGSTTAFVNDGTVKEIPGAFEFKGAGFAGKSGAVKGVDRTIVSYASGKLTLDTALPITPVVGDRYRIIKNYVSDVRQALEDVERDLYELGIRAEVLVDVQQIRGLVMLRASRNIAFTQIKSRDDVWAYKYETLDKQYRDALASLKAEVSSGGDGTMDGTTQMNQIEAGR